MVVYAAQQIAAPIGAMMIVIFGASSDIGRRLSERLQTAGYACREVSRSSHTARADLATGLGVAEVLEGAVTAVSCAHARFTDVIVRHAPDTLKNLVLTGSAWRYSGIPNLRADQVRHAEKTFLESPYSGVIIHPTMIYGGSSENNIRRLLSVIDRVPAIPAPGGGRKRVQPIYVEDVVACLFSAATTSWSGKRVIPVGGQPLQWKEMVRICSQAIGRPKPVIGIPVFACHLALRLSNAVGTTRIDPDIIRRFGEDVEVSTDEMTKYFSVTPRDFESGLKMAIAGWRETGML